MILAEITGSDIAIGIAAMGTILGIFAGLVKHVTNGTIHLRDDGDPPIQTTLFNQHATGVQSAIDKQATALDKMGDKHSESVDKIYERMDEMKEQASKDKLEIITAIYKKKPAD